jgi:flagellar biogenesis protein FliO
MAIELVKTLFALVAVLGLMYGVVVAMKKFFLMGPGHKSEIVDIEVLSQKALQPKRQLYVVKVLNKVIILSSTEHGIQAVGEIDDTTVVQSVNSRIEEMRLERASSRKSFTHKLYQAETLGNFFHKPANVILWRGGKPDVAAPEELQPEPQDSQL